MKFYRSMTELKSTSFFPVVDLLICFVLQDVSKVIQVEAGMCSVRHSIQC